LKVLVVRSGCFHYRWLYWCQLLRQ